MNPKVWLPPGTPFTSQVTAVLEVPVTVAVNCCVPKLGTFGDAGETVTVTLFCTVVVIVTIADADTLESFMEVTVTVISAGVGTTAGAVYNPAEVIVPFPDPPVTLQVTPVLNVPVTVAVNCWL